MLRSKAKDNNYKHGFLPFFTLVCLSLDDEASSHTRGRKGSKFKENVSRANQLYTHTHTHNVPNQDIW